MGGRLMFLVECTINTGKTIKSVLDRKGDKVCWAFCLIEFFGGFWFCLGFFVLFLNHLLFIIR